MPRGRRFFNDVCHLTVEGSVAFVANLMPEVVARVGAAGERAARD